MGKDGKRCVPSSICMYLCHEKVTARHSIFRSRGCVWAALLQTARTQQPAVPCCKTPSMDFCAPACTEMWREQPFSCSEQPFPHRKQNPWTNVFRTTVFGTMFGTSRTTVIPVRNFPSKEQTGRGACGTLGLVFTFRPFRSPLNPTVPPHLGLHNVLQDRYTETRLQAR